MTKCFKGTRHRSRNGPHCCDPGNHQALTGKAPAEVVEQALQGWYGSYIREIYPNWNDREDDLQNLSPSQIAGNYGGTTCSARAFSLRKQ